MPDVKILRYGDHESGTLQEKIATLIEKGWELKGPAQHDNGTFYATLIKTE